MKTKIICTLGPASSNAESIDKLIRAGVKVFRVNFSHGSVEENAGKLKLIKKLGGSTMADLPGPKLRVENFQGVLETGKTVLSSRLSIPKLKKGERVFLSDGLIELQVLNDRECVVLRGGEVRSGMGINIPSLNRLKSPTEKDLRIAKRIGGFSDFLALSYTQSRDSIRELRKVYAGNIVAKIETRNGVENLSEIISEADLVMIARGDLGVQLPFEQTPLIQKKIIAACEEQSKTAIVATQMLESMTKESFPTRAEVTDVANAVLDGADALLLSEETAIGVNPENAVKTMRTIIQATQSSIKERTFKSSNISQSIGESSKNISESIKARAILTKTRSGKTALTISRYKSQTPIIALTSSEKTFNKLLLAWNVTPVKVKSMEVLPLKDLFSKGDVVVLTYGSSLDTDSIKVIKV